MHNFNSGYGNRSIFFKDVSAPNDKPINADIEIIKKGNIDNIEDINTPSAKEVNIDDLIWPAGAYNK